MTDPFNRISSADLTDRKVYDKIGSMTQTPIPEGTCAADRERIAWRTMTDNEVLMTLLGAVINEDRATARRARRVLNRRNKKG